MLNRKIAPRITEAAAFDLKLPECEKYSLKNGVEVYSIDLGALDTLMVNIIFSAGNCYEEKNLVAGATSHLLKNGTSRRNSFAINEHFEYYGSSLSRSCQNENAEMALHCLGKYAKELLPVMAELLMDSVFPQEELEIFRKNSQQRLSVSLKKSDFVAGRLIDSYLFGKNHPYGRYSSMEDYASLSREHLQAFYEKYYKHGNCFIIVAGKLLPDMKEQLESCFGNLPWKGWKEKDREPEHAILPAGEKKYRVINDQKGVQGSIRIARNFPGRKHSDFQEAGVLNNIFGGYFGSRLMANIREDKGYTYGIYSYLLNHVQESAWMISTEAGRDVCEAAIDEVFKEMNLLCEKIIEEEELQTARNFMVGLILGDLDGPFQVASRWKNIILNGLDENYFDRGIRIIKTIGGEELKELARKYLRPEEFYQLVVV
jgi:predicted Zn-dependent peptidase